jgi:hypothetical protein
VVLYGSEARLGLRLVAKVDNLRKLWCPGVVLLEVILVLACGRSVLGRQYI